MNFNLDQLSEAQLQDLNRRIVERLRFLQQALAHQTMLRFSVGERVSFDTSDGRLVSGVLVRYNKKTVTVLTGADLPHDHANGHTQATDAGFAAHGLGLLRNGIEGIHSTTTARYVPILHHVPGWVGWQVPAPWDNVKATRSNSFDTTTASVIARKPDRRVFSDAPRRR
jgi:hypothetical protein